MPCCLTVRCCPQLQASQLQGQGSQTLRSGPAGNGLLRPSLLRSPSVWGCARAPRRRDRRSGPRTRAPGALRAGSCEGSAAEKGVPWAVTMQNEKFSHFLPQSPRPRRSHGGAAPPRGVAGPVLVTCSDAFEGDPPAATSAPGLQRFPASSRPAPAPL